MFTKETIREEIRELMEEPVTSSTSRVLASLLYIQEHFPCETKTAVAKESSELLYEWVDRMENADGTTGPHWSRHEAEVIRAKYGITCASDVAFYVVLNMMYSDYCIAASKAGASTVDLFAYMAEAFLKDPDAQPDKLGRYYRYIARHA